MILKIMKFANSEVNYAKSSLNGVNTLFILNFYPISQQTFIQNISSPPKAIKMSNP